MTESIEEYRKSPSKLNELGAVEMLKILTEDLGPLENICFIGSSWPESPFRFIKSVEKCEDETKILSSMLRVNMEELDWTILASLMLFYRVECFTEFTKVATRSSSQTERAFCRKFAFGCFKDQDYTIESNDSLSSYPLHHYFKGDMTLGLFSFGIMETENVTDKQFEIFRRELSKKRFYTSDIINTYKSLAKPWDMVSPNDDVEAQRDVRKGLFLETLRERILVPSDDHPYLYYAFQLKDHFRNRPVLGLPVWSRQNHLKIAHPEFKAQALTILLIRRFRSDAFGLHKDLIDTILRMVFLMSVREIEIRRKASIRMESALKTMDEMNKANFKLKWGIYTAGRSKKDDYADFEDAMILSLGGTLTDAKTAIHLKTLKQYLPYFEGCREKILLIPESWRVQHKETLQEEVYAYCVAHGLKPVDLWEGVVYLGDDFRV